MSLALPLTRFFRSAQGSGQARRNVALNDDMAAAPKPESKLIDAAMPLGLVTGGSRVQVVAFRNSGRGFEKRLEAMGIRVGSELDVLQHEGGATVVRVGETRVALGVAMMHRILVATLAG